VAWTTQGLSDILMARRGWSLLRAAVTAALARTRLVLGTAGDGPWVHLVEEGLLRPVAITPDGREFGLGLLGAGEAFLHHDGDSRRGIGFYVEAVRDSRCLTIPRADLPDLAARDPELAGRLLQALCGHVADLGELAASLCLDSAADRLLRLLRRLAERHGAADGAALRLRLRQQDLAAMAGLCRETVNASLRALAAAGHLRVGRQTVWIPAAAPRAHLPPAQGAPAV
jgi:CRP-like cAMP-binding protein